MSTLPIGQLSRLALLYLLGAFCACVLTLAWFLPWWLLPVASVCLAWRLRVFQGRLSFPPAWLRSLLVLLAGCALFLQYGWQVSLDVFVMLLLLGFSLKLLELYRQRDAQLLLYLAFFVLMTALLFDQGVGFAVIVMADIVLVVAALVAVQGDAAVQSSLPWQPLRKAGWLVVLSLPVMLFLFVVMPRLPPLWSMPLQKEQQAKTGMDDSMGPGDVASLARSSALAFRASFPEGLPPRRELYWYGLILDRFDGVRWTESCKDCRGQWLRSEALRDPAASSRSGKPYQVILEPHGNHWMYVLQPSRIRDSTVLTNRDGLYRFERVVDQRQPYDARWLLPADNSLLRLRNPGNYLQLPSTANPRAVALAAEWKAQSGEPGAIVQSALQYFHRQFRYTLQPPPVGEQRIDGFLFGTQQGFCEHFAGSFVFLMRAAGIPARVVLGYMGGEINTAASYVVVRQYDAHAWAEVWLEGQGWVRVDPTAAVAPERVDLGFAEAFADSDVIGGTSGLHQFAMLNALRLQLDYVDYLWARWVLGYEGEQQTQLLRSLGLLSPLTLAMWAGGGVVGVFVLLCIYLYWREWWCVHEPPATRRYRQLCHAYGQWGIERAPAETPLMFAGRVRSAGLPGSEEFSRLSEAYYQWRFLPAQTARHDPVSGYARRVRRLLWQLHWRRLTGRGNG